MSKTGGQTPQGQRPAGVTRWVYGLAAGLIVLASACLIAVGSLSSREADRHALEHEKELFATAVQQIQIRMSNDQRELAHSAGASKNIEKRFNEDFVQNDILVPLWMRYGFEQSFLIGPDNSILAESDHEQVAFAHHQLTPDNPLAILAEYQREKVLRRWPQTPVGQNAAPVPRIWSNGKAAFSFIVLNGKPSLASAVAIQSDTLGPAAFRKNDTILISAKVIDRNFLLSLGEQLPFPGLRFYAHVPDRPHPVRWVIRDAAGTGVGYFHWDGQKPGPLIWRTIVPMLLVMGVLLSTAAFFVARKVGRLSAALERSEQHNRYFALHDPLTGLANRLHFSDLLAEAIDKLPHRRFALFGCDLDHFKVINDTHGHSAGDAVIRTVAERLTRTVSGRGTVARIGGDEFVVLVDDFDEGEHLAQLAEDLIKTVVGPISLETGAQVQVGLSIGIAVAPLCGQRETEIIAAADTALYQAKEDGRNQAVFHYNLRRVLPKDSALTKKTEPVVSTVQAAG